jgi:hypothetical protein
MRVFISYDQKDKESAKELSDRLVEAGFAVWDAEREILPGDNWALKVGEALEESDAMIVLLSPESVRSPWIKREIEYALGSPKYSGRLVPVIVRPTEDIPWVLRQLKVVHLNKKLGLAAKQIANQLRRAS